ncbi:DUF6446 family protein [Acidimangrovimonas sediminis]|uniref:DUF6446 family protein n=1 Tax=Acidimangrovimonas sediminis TaxID=2056283 RepID=UPI000C802F39|nr:DUF6446 family protein [Acidimangrovimonas sediminis]
MTGPEKGSDKSGRLGRDRRRPHNGTLVVLGLMVFCAVAGTGLYYTLQYAARVGIDKATPAAKVFLTSAATGKPQEVTVRDFDGITSKATPVGYKACFRLDTAMPMLTQNFRTYADPKPTTAPRHFTCFNPARIDAALKAHTAIAFLGQPATPADAAYGVDRVVAVTNDGQAYAWSQLNRCGVAAYNARPVPEGCPPVPEDLNARLAH